MLKTAKVRRGWLKFMYILTIIVAGGGGLGILIMPDFVQWMFDVPSPQIISGIVGSTFIAFALLSVLGLLNPLKFAPILLMQLVYKMIWLIGVVLPLLTTGKVTTGMVPVIGVFAVVVICDLIAVPFSNIFKGVFIGSNKEA